MRRRDFDRTAPAAPSDVDQPRTAGSDRPALDSTALEIEALERMTFDELRAAWRQRLKSEPPQVRARDFLLRLLAWRLQAARFGGLGPDTQRRLKRLTREMASSPDLKLRTPVLVQPGSRLVREWRGVTHTVDVVSGGYIWEGRTYKTLTRIARAITGTSWSGPRFFGIEDVDAPNKPPRP